MYAFRDGRAREGKRVRLAVAGELIEHAKLAEWQKNYTALNREAIDTTWYLYNEIKCYKLAIDEVVAEFRNVAASQGKFSTLLLDGILTSIANATERDV